MPNPPMTLEETIEQFESLSRPRSTLSVACLHWLTTLKAENERLRAKLGLDVGEIDVDGVITDGGATLCRSGDELRLRFQRANHAIACLDYWSRASKETEPSDG